MLHQDVKSPAPSEPKNQAKLHFCCKQYIKKVAHLFIPRYFNMIICLSLKMKWQSCLKNAMLMFEWQQWNTSILIRPLWKPLTKSWQNCCLNRWMLKSFKTLKKFSQFGFKIWIKLWTKWTTQNHRWLIWSPRMQLN